MSPPAAAYQEQPPYSVFTPLYAATMGDLPYRDWFNFAARYFTLKNKKLLGDLFCGPAFFSREAVAAGYTCIAVDRHRAFLKKGVCANAAELPFPGDTFAGLVATNASLNYLEGPAALRRHLEECHRVLDAGAAYVFDLCPPERAAGLTTRSFEALAGRVRFVHNYAHPRLTTSVYLRRRRSETGREEINVVEHHEQYIFSEAEFLATAAATDLDVIERIPNYGLPASGENFPVMTWVLRKDAAAPPRRKMPAQAMQ